MSRISTRRVSLLPNKRAAGERTGERFLHGPRGHAYYSGHEIPLLLQKVTEYSFFKEQFLEGSLDGSVLIFFFVKGNNLSCRVLQGIPQRNTWKTFLGFIFIFFLLKCGSLVMQSG